MSVPQTTPLPQSRREKILDDARDLFAERGYEGTSMADLAARVGLRKASLFHHFPSKEVLYATVLARLVEEVGSAIMSSAALEGSFAERLDELTDKLVMTLGSQPCAARLLVREVMDWGPVVRDHLADPDHDGAVRRGGVRSRGAGGGDVHQDGPAAPGPLADRSASPCPSRSAAWWSA